MFTPAQSIEDIPSINEMIASMDRTVAGLEQFKERLAVVMRDFMVAAFYDRSWKPANILIVGPTGVGKTYTVKALLESLPVVFCEVALTEFSDTGYHGRDLPSQYLGLNALRQREILGEGRGGKPRRISAIAHRQRAERWGVVLMDEFDKLRTNKTSVPGERAVGKVLQFELLKLVEGTEAQVQEQENGPTYLFRTHNVMHIAMGAFEGINTMIAKFDNLEFSETLYERATPEDFIEYGFIQELMGRFATILTLPPLKNDHLERILREQLVPEYVQRLADEGLELVVDQGARISIANMAMQRAIGARALEPILRNLLWRGRRTARRGDRLVIDAQAVGAETARLEPRVAV
jgi:ATP-dependent Clp protease ATP-binding subunit ClpX